MSELIVTVAQRLGRRRWLLVTAWSGPALTRFPGVGVWICARWSMQGQAWGCLDPWGLAVCAWSRGRASVCTSPQHRTPSRTTVGSMGLSKCLAWLPRVPCAGALPVCTSEPVATLCHFLLMLTVFQAQIQAAGCGVDRAAACTHRAFQVCAVTGHARSGPQCTLCPCAQMPGKGGSLSGTSSHWAGLSLSHSLESLVLGIRQPGSLTG